MIIEMISGLSLMFLLVVTGVMAYRYKLYPALSVFYTTAVNSLSMYMLLCTSLMGFQIFASSSITVSNIQDMLPFLVELFIGVQGRDWSMKHVFS